MKLKIDVRTVVLCAFLFPALTQSALSQAPEWPRETSRNGSRILLYQPQVDDWKNFTDLHWRSAFSLTPPGGKEAVGVVTMRGRTDVNTERDLVVITGLQIERIHFPSLDQAAAAELEATARGLVPETAAISLHSLVACVPKSEAAPSTPVRNDPPKIFVSNRPAVLLFVEGQPSLAPISKTSLEFVVNTSWPLFLDKAQTAYYLLVGEGWLKSSSLQGPWTATKALPADMAVVAKDPEWAALAKTIPPPQSSAAVSPLVLYSNEPADVILFDGKPLYSPIPGTQLTYATNTSSNVFMHGPTKQVYYLTSGRWFRAQTLDGPWSFATAELPSDFARIPASHPAGRVLSSVPGTEEAKDAVLLAQIPTTLVINDPAAAAAQAKVAYSGDPKFSPIEGTSLAYATNTQDKVIKVGDVYYLCLQGIWFMSASPQGPWKTANSVPQEIYTIPPSSPVYNVTYVTQTTSSSGQVTSSHTAGYMGAFIAGMTVGAVVTYGSGYYYPPYVYRPPYGYPVYRPYPPTYGWVTPYRTGTGAYGWAQTAYGPYGSATRAAQYNPYTGTAARGASVSTPYGSRAAAQAYNPYTGTYAATAQGSAPGAQWGASTVSRGGETAYAQHYSTAQGTAARAQTTSGGRAAGVSTAYGTTAAGKTSSGDMYATHDGNVYKNTGSGWQTYDNSSGSWNSAQAQAQQQAQSAQQQRAASGQPSAASAQGTAQQRAASAQGSAQQRAGQYSGSFPSQELNRESMNRQRGAAQSERFQQASGSYAGRSGGGGRRR